MYVCVCGWGGYMGGGEMVEAGVPVGLGCGCVACKFV
jgi:hypothetical protein